MKNSSNQPALKGSVRTVAWPDNISTAGSVKESQELETNLQRIARRIREEHAQYWAFIQSLSQIAERESTRAGALLAEAGLHKNRIGELLLLVRDSFRTNELWESWLKEQCLMNVSIANQFMRGALGATSGRPAVPAA